MPKVIIIGGGICGLSSAWYLAKAGWDVTVLDKNDFMDNCSWGNAGFVCPSHYIQLATPGIVKQGIKWMFNRQSPFYIQPRLSKQLIYWGLSFIKSARKNNIEQNGIPLRDIGLLSQYEYENVWHKEMSFDYAHKGMLEIFKTVKGKEESAQVVEFGKRLGLDVELLDIEALQALEPYTKIKAIGAINYKCDAHLNPGSLMRALLQKLPLLGVKMVSNATVTGITASQQSIQSVSANDVIYKADAFVLAAGAWSSELVRNLGLKMPIVAGRGYSVTLPAVNGPLKLQHPGILLEGRCAFTPIGDSHIRFGGTMEITNENAPPRLERVKGILRAVNDFFPGINITPAEVEGKVWYGFRPVSGDGMPYIGKVPGRDNLVVASGHGQLGISLGAATGLLACELLEGRKTSVDISAFKVERFG